MFIITSKEVVLGATENVNIFPKIGVWVGRGETNTSGMLTPFESYLIFYT